MSHLTIIGIAIALAMDAFAVAIACSVALKDVSRSQVLRMSFHFGLFQFLMPVAGWLAGLSFVEWIAPWDHWVAFALLGSIGGHMIYTACFGVDEEKPEIDRTRGVTLIMLSIATSIDALAVGLSFAVLQVNVWYPSVIIGLVAAGLTALGMRIGGRIGSRFGKRMEIVGGIVLIGLGLKILYSHLAA